MFLKAMQTYIIHHLQSVRYALLFLHSPLGLASRALELVVAGERGGGGGGGGGGGEVMWLWVRRRRRGNVVVEMQVC
jgi:hypothetical protein